MAAEPTLNVRDLFLVLRRRPLFVLLVTALLTSAAGFLILQIPDVYTSRSVIFLDQGRLPKGFQQAGVIVPPLGELIGRLRQEVLSREVLREVVTDIPLYERREMDAKERDKLFSEGPKGWMQFLLYRDPIDRAREDIRIEIVKRNGQEFIEVSADARASELSSRVVNRIADILASKNRDLRIRKGEEVESFLEEQLARVKTAMEEHEEGVKKFRAERQETLPENAEALNNRLSELKTRSEGRLQQIRANEAARATMEFRIAARLKQAARDYKPERPVSIQREKTPEEAELERLLREDEKESITLKANHPRRKQLLAQIQLLREHVRKTLAEIGVETGEEEAAPEGEGEEAKDAEGAEGEEGEKKEGEAEGEQGAKEEGEAAEGDGTDVAEVDGGGEGESGPETIGSIGIWNGRIDQERIVQKLVDLNASPELLEEVQTLIARIAAISGTLEDLARGQERELQEIDRLEMLRSALAPTRIQLARIEKDHEDSLETFREIERDWQTIQKFLAAERALRGDQLRVIEAAEAPLLPSSPNRPLLGFGSLTASFLISLCLGALIERGRRTYRTAAEVEEDLRVPVLATLPSVGSLDDDDRDYSFLSARNRTLRWLGREQLHRLRCAIGSTPKNGEIRSVLVTSSVESEGKSLVATGLAFTIAKSLDHWALLVETDLRRPSIGDRLRLEPGPGLAEHIVDGTDLSRSMRSIGVPKLTVVCAGEKAGQVQAAHIVASASMRRLAEEVRERYPDRFVVYDAPPVIPTPDPMSLARMVDGIVFVVQAGKTPRKLVQRAIAALPAEKVLGVVLNQVEFDRHELRYMSAYYAEERIVDEGQGDEALEAGGSPDAIDYDAPTMAIGRLEEGIAVLGARKGEEGAEAAEEEGADDGLPKLKPIEEDAPPDGDAAPRDEVPASPRR